MIYLFYRDDSLTSLSFTMRTEQLTKSFSTTSEAEGEVWRLLNRLKPPVIFEITGSSKALLVLLILFSVFACFGVNFCTVFTFCVSTSR